MRTSSTAHGMHTQGLQRLNELKTTTLETIEKISFRLEEAESSTSEFLHRQKLLFPKFWTVSDANLIQLLSLGTP